MIFDLIEPGNDETTNDARRQDIGLHFHAINILVRGPEQTII
jgi:hypothetical protein